MAQVAVGRPVPASVKAWTRYGSIVLWLVVAHAAVTAALRLVPAFDALVFVPDAAIDLLIRHDEVLRWFRGIPIYGDAHSANYPPASYALLWPFIGWLAEAGMRILWGISVLGTLAAIAVLSIPVSGATRAAEKAFIALFLLPLGATQITVWIGQLGLHVTAAVLGAALLLLPGRERDPAAPQPRWFSWALDLLAAALLAFSLIKPTLSVPLVATLLILAGRWRPAILSGLVYLGVTAIAAAFQEGSMFTLLMQWLGREDIMNLPLGSANLHLWLYWLGFEGSMIPASLLVLGAFLFWVWRQRAASPWLVLGAAALVSRLWIHHRAFDDVLLVLAALALFRIAKTASAPRSVALTAALLVAALYATGQAPWAYLSGETRSLWLITEVSRTCIWLASLAFLVAYTHMQDREPAIAVPAGRRTSPERLTA